jgi:hypothetical protein
LDLSARGARLGQVYRDLGFEQLALIEGHKSIALIPSNYSAHRLLADNYLALPRHRIARDSELLQAQLLQPINLNPVQPRLAVNGALFLDDPLVSGVGLNEFTNLFMRDGVRFTGDLVAGEQDTRADNVILSGLVRRLSFSGGQFYAATDGFRRNSDIEQRIYNLFVQAALSDSTGVQVEIRDDTTEHGERRLLFDPAMFDEQQRTTFDTTGFRVGGRHSFSPGSVVIASYSRRSLNSDLQARDIFRWLQDESAGLGEARYIHETTWINMTAGFGLYRGERLETLTFGSTELPTESFTVRHTNAYAYVDVKLADPLVLHAGLSREAFRWSPGSRTM